MGLGSERHDVASFETHSGRWIGFRQPVMRRYAELKGDDVGADHRTHEFNKGEVWEENEFWIDLSWRIDPDGSLGIRQFFESDERPGTPMGVDEYYARMFDTVPGLADDAAAVGQTPLEYMRDRGAYAIRRRHVRAVRARGVRRCRRRLHEGRGDGVFRKPGHRRRHGTAPTRPSTT